MSRIRTAAALGAAAALLLTGCASSSTPTETGASDAEAGGAFPVTITHALGETTIPAKPERVAAIRARGWAIDDEERTEGMRCIAAPVFDLTGEAIAGLSVSGPTHRIGAEHIKTLGAAVVSAAGDLSQALGGERP